MLALFVPLNKTLSLQIKHCLFYSDAPFTKIYKVLGNFYNNNNAGDWL